MPKRILEGDVVSDKMDKSVTVLVERRYKHPVYKKYVKRTDKYTAHDESNAFAVGDRVQIEECKPISKRKSWTVISKPSGKAPKKVEETVKEAKAPEAKEEKAKSKKKTATKKKAASKKKDEKK
jgi:small subunit ribosomal protein S17